VSEVYPLASRCTAHHSVDLASIEEIVAALKEVIICSIHQLTA
jgi:hypothetical protein